jgi:uncharacterized surface protein with fasciclin (FAS1) repeats
MTYRATKLLGTLCLGAAVTLPALAHAGAAQIWYQKQKAEMAARAAGSTTGSSTVLDVIRAQGQFNTFLKAVDAAGLTATLQQGDQYTVFAPTDEAFAQIPKSELDALMKDRDRLKQVIGYHIVPKRKYGWDLRRDALATLNGRTVRIAQYTSPEDIRLNDNVEVLETDLRAANGVVHAIGRVMLPES